MAIERNRNFKVLTGADIDIIYAQRVVCRSILHAFRSTFADPTNATRIYNAFSEEDNHTIRLLTLARRTGLTEIKQDPPLLFHTQLIKKFQQN